MGLFDFLNKTAPSFEMEPFVFKSNQHQRYKGSEKEGDLQRCFRTISVEKNTNGCKGYRLEPGKGYIVKIFNDDLGKPQMSDKPMLVVRKTDTSVELRGFPIMAQGPFGWQEVDYRDYGLNVHFEHGYVSKCVLHMYDRNTFIEYRYVDESRLRGAAEDSEETEAEQYAQMATCEARSGNSSRAHQYGIKVFESIISDGEQIKKIADVQNIALALGKTIEGDYFSGETILQAVGITYYFLTKAIKQGCENPYLYVYRFSLVWEYNKSFYHLFAGSEGRPLNTFSMYDPFCQASMMSYDHHMQGMQMADMLTEPRIARLDPALGNIFNEMYAKYSKTPSEQIISIGNEYHDQIYKYLSKKIEMKDFDFE